MSSCVSQIIHSVFTVTCLPERCVGAELSGTESQQSTSSLSSTSSVSSSVYYFILFFFIFFFYLFFFCFNFFLFFVFFFNLFFYSFPLNCGVAAADTILIHPAIYEHTNYTLFYFIRTCSACKIRCLSKAVSSYKPLCRQINDLAELTGTSRTLNTGILLVCISLGTLLNLA